MGIKNKIMLLNLGVLFVFGFIVMILFYKSQSSQKSEIRKGFDMHSQVLETSLSQKFYTHYNNVKAFANQNVLASKDFDQISYVLNKTILLYPAYDLIILTDEKGKYISSNSQTSTGEDLNINQLLSSTFENEDWFQAIKKGNVTEDIKKNISGTFVGKFKYDEIITKIYKGERYGNSFTTAVEDEFGDPLGYLTTYVNISWINKELKNLYSSLVGSGKLNGLIKLINNEGIILGDINQSLYDSFDWISTLNKSKLAVIPKDTLSKLRSSSKNGSETETFFTRIKNLFIADKPLYTFKVFDNSQFLSNLNWAIEIEVSSKDAFKLINDSQNIFNIVFFSLIVIATLVSIKFSNSINLKIGTLTKNLSDGSVKLSKVSIEMLENAEMLSSASITQSAHLQETAASLVEISGIVDSNTEASKESDQAVKICQDLSSDGKNIVKDMINGINRISECDAEIHNELDRNNTEIAEIINVISSIAEKTKVINDIVFQTKLLSFNASIEAARAGEHGKGFAVVAEEVGNLAKMSGESATEISQMLQDSIQKVQGIIDKTTSNVTNLISNSKKEIDSGKEIAVSCEKSLGEINSYVIKISNMLGGISKASSEQSTSINEINKSMSVLDTLTHNNSSLSQSFSHMTKVLDEEIKNIKYISVDLDGLVKGLSHQDNQLEVSVSNESRELNEPVDESVDESNKIPSEDDSKFKEVS